MGGRPSVISRRTTSWSLSSPTEHGDPFCGDLDVGQRAEDPRQRRLRRQSVFETELERAEFECDPTECGVSVGFGVREHQIHRFAEHGARPTGPWPTGSYGSIPGEPQFIAVQLDTALRSGSQNPPVSPLVHHVITAVASDSARAISATRSAGPVELSPAGSSNEASAAEALQSAWSFLVSIRQRLARWFPLHRPTYLLRMNQQHPHRRHPSARPPRTQPTHRHSTGTRRCSPLPE